MPAAAVAVAVALCAGDAMAWSRGSSGSSSSSSGSYGSSSSSSGSYGSSSSSSGSSCSGSSCSGSSCSGGGGLFARWHARKAARASSSSSSYGSSSSSSGSSSSSSGSYGSYGGGAYYESAPMEMEGQSMMPESAPAATPEPPAPPQASINVTVPADAVVFVNDRATTSTGANRHFISRGLMMGRTYAYQIRVEFQKDGEKVVENKLVRLQAGQNEELSFGNGEQMVKQAEPAKTQVTVHVPEGAKVTLSGAETHQTGELRTFVSTTLAGGEKWDGYTVVATLERDGKVLTQEKTLSIEGGQNYEVSFDFSDNTAKVASLN